MSAWVSKRAWVSNSTFRPFWRSKENVSITKKGLKHPSHPKRSKALLEMKLSTRKKERSWPAAPTQDAFSYCPPACGGEELAGKGWTLLMCFLLDGAGGSPPAEGGPHQQGRLRWGGQRRGQQHLETPLHLPGKGGGENTN